MEQIRIYNASRTKKCMLTRLVYVAIANVKLILHTFARPPIYTQRQAKALVVDSSHLQGIYPPTFSVEFIFFFRLLLFSDHFCGVWLAREKRTSGFFVNFMASSSFFCSQGRKDHSKRVFLFNLSLLFHCKRCTLTRYLQKCRLG